MEPTLFDDMAQKSQNETEAIAKGEAEAPRRFQVTPAKSFNELRAQMSSEAQSRSTVRAQAMLVEMQLQEVSKTCQVKQVNQREP
jgi:hypothetical protein